MEDNKIISDQTQFSVIGTRLLLSFCISYNLFIIFSEIDTRPLLLFCISCNFFIKMGRKMEEAQDNTEPNVEEPGNITVEEEEDKRDSSLEEDTMED